MYEELIRLGIEVYSDGCILEYRNKKLGTNTMMSNSGKFDTYCFSMRGLQPVFGSMKDCIESAVAGRVCKGGKAVEKVTMKCKTAVSGNVRAELIVQRAHELLGHR